MRDFQKKVSKILSGIDEIAREQQSLQRISNASSVGMLAKILRANTRIQDADAVAKVARLFIEASPRSNYTSGFVAKKLRLPVSLVCDIISAMESEGFIKEYRSSCSFWSLRLDMDLE